MSGTQLVLRALRKPAGRSSSPGETHEFRLPTGDRVATRLALSDGSLRFYRDGETSQHTTDELLALMESGRSHLTLSPEVKGICIESPPTPDMPRDPDWDRIPIPMNTESRMHFVLLRPGDIIHFTNHGYSVRVDAEPATSLDEAEDVLVKSSLAKDAREAEAVVQSESEEDSTDGDDDLDNTVHGNVETPVATRQPEGQVDETPSRVDQNEEDVQFSTAPDRHTQASNNGAHESTPAARASESQQSRMRRSRNPVGAEPQQRSAASLLSVNHVETSNAAESQEGFFMNETSATVPRITYGPNPSSQRRRRTQTPEARESPVTGRKSSARKQELSADKADEMESNDETAGASDSVVPPSDGAPPILTSELNEHDAAQEAAARSTKRRWKRKHDLGDEEENTPLANKRRKAVPSEKTLPGAEQNGEKAESPAATGRPKRAKKGGRTSKVNTEPEPRVESDAEQETDEGELVDNMTISSAPSVRSEKSNSTEGSSDKIAVANVTSKKPPKSSPQVRITSKRTSTTPTAGAQPEKILLSSSKYGNDLRMKKWLTSQGISVEAEVPNKRVNFLCVVGEGELKTTVKLLRSLALCKLVVTDRWLAESIVNGRLLDASDFVHEEVADTATKDRGKLFKGKTVYCTQRLKADYDSATGSWSSVETLLKDAGASRLDFGNATKAMQRKGRDNVILLGSPGKKDVDVPALIGSGRTVYNKDLISQSIIRGELLVDDDALQLTGS